VRNKSLLKSTRSTKMSSTSSTYAYELKSSSHEKPYNNAKKNNVAQRKRKYCPCPLQKLLVK
jgi:hypothetical protein